MQVFKQAIWLAKFELKLSWVSFIFLFLYYSLFTLLFVQGFNVTEEQFVGLDIFFLLLFLFSPTWFRPKAFQYQQISGSLWAAPGAMMGLYLPLKKQVIVLKSLIVYMLLSIPFQLYTFITLYVFSPGLQKAMTLDAYIAFAIIWIAFGIYVGFMAPAIDIGTRITSTRLTFLLSILVLAIIILLILFFPYFFKHGVVGWTIILATKWPLLSIIVSIVVAVIGFNYWRSKMAKVMKQMDYL
ncbi:hypothetical protein [Ornithinibacillus xuwenensis]|uniref:Uncharacterized protein n=1 Tax=Ornithinibacillus xuwenensis TaxID=3144668 RepID=A0ABU9XFW9_9BACI